MKKRINELLNEILLNFDELYEMFDEGKTGIDKSVLSARKKILAHDLLSHEVLNFVIR